MTWIFVLPWWLSMLLVTVVAVAFSCTGHVLVRRAFPKTDFIEHNEVAGFIIAVVGVLYAVLLGFLTVIVWQQFADAEDRSVQEVDATTDIWRFAHYADPADRTRLTSDLRNYVASIVDDEWPKMKAGASSDRSQSFVQRLFADVSMMRVADLRQANLQNHLMERVQIAGDLRRRRINSDHSALPPVVWTGILAGAGALMGFIYLFGLANFRAQLLMTAATAVMIGLCLSIVVELDYPFRGDISISPERWQTLNREMSAPR